MPDLQVTLFDNQPPVEVIRSARRRRTVEATMRNGVLRLAIPARMTKREERHWVNVMRERFAKPTVPGDLELLERAAGLAAKYELPLPVSVTWSERQQTLWGSCTSADRAIRISTRLREVPPWVLDSVLVHEMAHLIVNGHDAEFDSIMQRYELHERATGYLQAMEDLG